MLDAGYWMLDSEKNSTLEPVKSSHFNLFSDKMPHPF